MNFNNVLFVAPNFNRRKGGIASVLTTYEKNIKGFHFFSSAHFSNKWLNFIFLPLILSFFFFYLLIHSKIKIVHIHGASRGSFYRKYFFFLIAKKVFHKRVIYHIHGGEFHLFYKNAQRVLQKRIEKMIVSSDALIVLSKEWKKYFEGTFQQKSIFIVNNIVEKADCKTRFDTNKIVLLFLGRIGKGKGVYDLLNVIIDKKGEFNNKLKLIIGGDGDVDKLKDIIKTNSLENIVSYIGWVSGDLKKELFEKCNIMILPSYNEGLPISLLEAMSYSMPIISTNVGGIPQVLEDRVNGKMVTPGNKQQIGDAITYYINNNEQIEIHGKISYNKVQDFFPKQVLKKLKLIFDSIS